MRARLYSWWQKIQKHPFIVTGILVLFSACIAFALAVHWLGWDWTGFTGYSPPTPQYQRGKTLWDWLQLLTALAIPVVVGFGAAWFSAKQTQVNEATNKQQHETELEIATDNQRETALQAYIDKMSELLLEKNLRGSAENDEVRTIARVRTLTVLPRLDGKRKRSLLLFLYEASLIGKDKVQCIIDLRGVDLRGADLTEANLTEANLTRALLNGANLTEAILTRAKLFDTELREANLTRALLNGVNLTTAHLNGANLTEANLSEANLFQAVLDSADLHKAHLHKAGLLQTSLTEANLSEATVTEEQLNQAHSLKGATMPDGSIHP